eukprot:TRINITY_DN7297_c0_g1_i1.p1 TRINITY_DN7297_c0_g1~~TRINITY_DN7297_c0_g1_i1.p1  ORF type:complete len:146 (+),score=28.88 TRINITY_DN7297_c0_g1_i1:68-505(+)
MKSGIEEGPEPQEAVVSTQSTFFLRFRMNLSGGKKNARLPPEVNRILFVKGLPYDLTGDEMYDLFGKYGAIRQIRMGNRKDTKGTAFVVYEDIYDAKNAREHLSGFNVKDRYLIVLYFQKQISDKRKDMAKQQKEIDALRAQLDS